MTRRVEREVVERYGSRRPRLTFTRGTVNLAVTVTVDGEGVRYPYRMIITGASGHVMIDDMTVVIVGAVTDEGERPRKVDLTLVCDDEETAASIEAAVDAFLYALKLPQGK